MQLTVTKTPLDEIRYFRNVFLHENNFQFTYDKCHLYGWADTYAFIAGDVKVGYGSVWGKEKREDRDSIFEFFVIEPYRNLADALFKEFQKISSASFIECQSNDMLLTTLLFQYTNNIGCEAILFEDHQQTDFVMPGVICRKKLVKHEEKNDRDVPYELLAGDVVVASGGMMLNYNMPYADIYYGVDENHRQKGYGSYFLQELKKETYRMGRIPAARCNINNTVSKRSLIKAGFRVCGFRLYGEIRK